MIERLQSKSDTQKAFYAMASAAVVVALLFGMWGYNFAHSGKISNIASGAAGVVQTVEDSNISENFKGAMAQLQQISDLAVGRDVTPEGVSTSTSEQSAGAKHKNVFVDPASTVELEQDYGANTADVLY